MARKKEYAEYLKSDEIGLVMAKGMAVMYKQNPKNPVDFLAKWLLNYSQVERAAEQRIDAQRIVEDFQMQHRQHLEDEKQKEEQE